MTATTNQLKTHLRYNQKTGIFIWIKAPKNKKQLQDQEAGYIHEGYILIELNGKTYRAHHLAWLFVYGYMPKRIDHKNGIKHDNKINNLRRCTHGQNRSNSRINCGKTLPKGVNLKPNGRCESKIRHNKKLYYLGVFDTPEQAHEAYKKAAIRLHGEFARFD